MYHCEEFSQWLMMDLKKKECDLLLDFALGKDPSPSQYRKKTVYPFYCVKIHDSYQITPITHFEIIKKSLVIYHIRCVRFI